MMKKYSILFRALFFVMIFFGIFAAFSPVKAHAINNNEFWIPTFITNNQQANSLRTCDRPNPPAGTHPQWNYAQFRWISPAGAYKTTSTTPSLDVNYGQPSVALAVNYLSSICNANIDGPYDNIDPYFHGGIQVKDKKITRFTNVAGTASSSMNGQPFGTLSGIDGEFTDVLYADGYANNWRYMTESDAKPFHRDFTLSGIGGLSVGLHTIEVKTDVRVVHKWIDNRFVCVDYQTPGDTGDASSLNDPKCLKGPTTMTIVLNVLPPEDKSPTGSPTVTCSGVDLSGVEDPNVPDRDLPFDVYYANPPGGFITTGTASGGSNSASIPLRNVVPPGTALSIGVYNYNYANVNDNSKAHWIGVTWSPDPNCPPPYSINPTPTLGLSPDSESPTSFNPSVDFTASFPWGTNYDLSNVDIKCKFYILKADGTKPLSEDDDHADVDFNSGNGYKQSCSKSGGFTSLGTYNLRAGDQVCVDYSVDPGSGNIELPSKAMITPGGAKTGTSCKPIVNRPYVSVFGGDVVAGGSVCSSGIPAAGSDIKGSRNGDLGSGVQFAAMALGTANAFNTHSMVASQSNSLWFANSTATLGGFTGGVPCVPDYAADGAAIAPDVAAGTLDLGTAALNGKHKIITSATLTTIDTSEVKKSQKTELYVKGDVYIKGKVTFESGATTRAEIPYFKLVVEGNIYIDKSVTELNGIYVAQALSGGARGKIYTCTDAAGAAVADSALYTSCNKQLVVNGAFIARFVQLQRSLGSVRNADRSHTPYSSSSCDSSAGNTSGWKGCAGEIFNLSPQTYLGTNEVGGGGPGDQNNFITTLPPIL